MLENSLKIVDKTQKETTRKPLKNRDLLFALDSIEGEHIAAVAIVALSWVLLS